MVTTAEQLDERYRVVGTISGAVTAVTEKVVGLDKALGVSETAYKVDEKVSGGIGASLVNRGIELVNTSVDYVTGALQQAKVTAAEANGTQTSAVNADEAAANADQADVNGVAASAADAGKEKVAAVKEA